jgi:hypothetical protein
MTDLSLPPSGRTTRIPRAALRHYGAGARLRPSLVTRPLTILLSNWEKLLALPKQLTRNLFVGAVQWSCPPRVPRCSGAVHRRVRLPGSSRVHSVQPQAAAGAKMTGDHPGCLPPFPPVKTGLRTRHRQCIQCTH